MIRIHADYYVPKYKYGKWFWNAQEERFEFSARNEPIMIKEEIVNTGGFKFLGNLNQIEEMIFRQEFQRSDLTHDFENILVQDIINLVLFLAPSDIINKDFITFVHTKTVGRFMHALIIYFEHFLKMVEFLLIRRDEISIEMANIQSEESNEIKRIFSSHLTQYRLILAREYSTIILGQGDMRRYYHLKPVVNLSQSIRDKRFHESFLAFCTQVVWISMHRRAYDVIDNEMNRLFRSDHFKLTRVTGTPFNVTEANMLYGKNYKLVNYRAQNSPLLQELANVADVNLPILWIGERKYRGTDYRIHELELEFIVPSSQLQLIEVSHGILGHPKKIYNTILSIDWEAVRFENYSDHYDPFNIHRQPVLRIPKVDEEKMRKFGKKYESYYHIIDKCEKISSKTKRKWVKRDIIVNYFKTEGTVANILTKCMAEITRTSYGPSVGEITRKFIERKVKLQKK